MDLLTLLTSETPDLAAIERAWPDAARMRACPQDAVYHAEGDVWTHTGMVVEALIADPEFRDLAPERRQALLLAAWFHDVGKPKTTEIGFDPVEGRERVRQPGHARLGARMAWTTLWRAGLARPLRERVQWLIAWHQKPFHLWTAASMERQAITFSLVGDWRDLLILARADNRGRIAPNRRETQETLDLLGLWLDEQGLLDRPFGFANGESRVRYFARPDRSPHFAAPEPEGSRVVILSGLPGSGKDTHVATRLAGLPVVSLDRLRVAMGVSPEDEQGRVVQAALEAARVHLRRREAFVWNTTGLTVQMRAKIIGLALDYGAEVAIHALDRPEAQVLRQNRSRDAVVPETAIDRLAAKWEPPSLLEAHTVEWV